jgi:threonine/homoserine/homoserine lactone efflux protein
VLVFTVIKFAGAGYMVWLGLQALRHRRALHVDEAALAGPPLPGRRAVRQGFVVGVTNPKAFMMYAAVLPQFIVRDNGQVLGQLLVLGFLAFLIGIVSDAVWAVLASQLRSWFNDSPERGRALGTAGGVSMIGLGVALAATGPPQ